MPTPAPPSPLRGEPVPEWSAPLLALWHESRGHWDEAHALVQDDAGPEASWVHAYLHRREGDPANAAYWYRRAGQPVGTGDLDAERDAIAAALRPEPAGHPLPSAPAALRNREPILAVLRRVLPRSGTVLELASGTGEHAVCFAEALPHLLWQPSEADPSSLRVVAARQAAAGLANLRPPVALDVRAAEWPLDSADALVAINMIHISPPAATEGLMAGAGRLLRPGGCLVLYGPFRERDVPTAPSNEAFDASLKARDPAWGLRDRDAVLELAERHGLALAERVAMPANNLILVFRRHA